MFDFKMLDVAIGVVFFFTFASLICTTIRELVESLIGTRAKMLETSLREILDDPTPTAQKGQAKSILVRFFEHPYIDSLFRGEYTPSFSNNTKLIGGFLAWWERFWKYRKLPSYIPPQHFAAALLDVTAPSALQNPPPPGLTPMQAQFQALRAAVANSNFALKGAPGANGPVVNDRLRTAILWALDNSDEDIAKARQNLETWFDNSMQRVTGWYKRQTQVWLFGIGLVVAALFNMNTMTVVEKLYYNEEFRTAALADATRAVSNPEWAKSHGIPTQTSALASKNAVALKEAAVESAPSQASAPSTPPAAPAVAKTPVMSAASGNRANALGDAKSEAVKNVATAPAAAPPASSPAPDLRSATPPEPVTPLPSPAEKASETEAAVTILTKELTDVGYPIGWTNVSWAEFAKIGDERTAVADRWATLGRYTAGWTLTAIAMTLGASFWFDLLNKLVSLRSSLKPEDASRQKEENVLGSRGDKEAANDLLKQATETLKRTENVHRKADAALKEATAAQNKMAVPPPQSAALLAPATNSLVDDDELRMGCLCDIALGAQDAITPDEQLPQAHGGVSLPERSADPKPEDRDGCDLDFKAGAITADADLPPASGGVA